MSSYTTKYVNILEIQLLFSQRIQSDDIRSADDKTCGLVWKVYICFILPSIEIMHFPEMLIYELIHDF